MTAFDEVTKQWDFLDRFVREGEEFGLDVIIPLLHSTPFWKQNLFSYYREIPINRLLVGDAGAIDGSIEVLTDFPRVVIYDHRKIATLAKSVSSLINEVESEFFVYVQSDTFLPEGWFDSMSENSDRYEWFGCVERPLVVLEGPINDYSGKRPLAGTQFGRSAYFAGVNDHIDDDYGYRQEDFIFEDYVLRRGGRVGGIQDVSHVHQLTHRKTTGRRLNVEAITVSFQQESDDVRVISTQFLGFVKYCDLRRPSVARATAAALAEIMAQGASASIQALRHARRVNPRFHRYFFRLVPMALAILVSRKVRGLRAFLSRAK